MKRFVFPLLLVWFSIKLNAQDVFKMTTGIVSSCNAYVLDADSMRGNIPAGINTLTINSTSGSKLAFNLDMYQCYADDTLSVYDGPNISAPLLYKIPTGVITNNPGPAVISTGSSITIRFRASAPITGIPRRFKTSLRCVTDPTNIPSFIPFGNNVGLGSIKLADYDKDGDKDLLVGGDILRNDSFLDSLIMFDRKFAPLGKWTATNMVAHDFDADGDKDIFITGSSSVPGPFAPYASLYRNDGTGGFSRVTTQSFVGAYSGAVSIVDFNRDGRMDICYTGRTNLTGIVSPVFKLYLNNGAMSFTDAAISLPGTAGLINASIDWADSDADGDADLLINGINAGTNYTRFFTVSGSSFTQQSLGFISTSAGQIRWVDINKDGKPDIVNTGVMTANSVDAIVPQLFINNGSNSFTEVATNLPPFYRVTHDWSDYDADGDMDAVFSGTEVISSIAYNKAAVYKYNGAGNFTRKGVDTARGGSLAKWVTINADARPDLFISGRLQDFSYYLKNMGNDSFKVSSFPVASLVTNGRVALAEDFTGDGVVDVLIADEFSGIDCSSDYGSIMYNGIDWRLAAVPKYTRVANLRTLVPAPGSGANPFSFYWRWADYDSDGVLDVMYFDRDGPVGPQIWALRNNGGNNFSVAFNPTTTNIPGTARNSRDAAMVDLDNDGVNEWFITPNTVLKKSGSNWNVSYEVAGCNAATDCPDWYADFGDFNNDGFMDAAVSNNSDHAGIGTVFLLKNNGSGVLQLYGAQMVKRGRQVKWHDIDRDGDLDLVVGWTIYENRNSEFFAMNTGIEGFVHAGIGDFNNDGSDDVVTVGGLYFPVTLPGSFYYGMQNKNFFKPVGIGKLYLSDQTAWEDCIEAFDIDNDGDIDIPQTAGGLGCGEGLLINLGNLQRRSIQVWSPNGGETYLAGSTQTVKWLGNQLGTTVKIEISTNAGLSWQNIQASVPSTPTGGSFNWTVSGPAADKCLIRITDNSSGGILDISNEFFKITIATGVGNPNLNNEITLYPNPVNGRFYMKTPTNISRTVSLKICNATGNTIVQQEILSSALNSQGVDVSHFPPGFYVVTVQDKNKNYNGKLIKF